MFFQDPKEVSTPEYERSAITYVHLNTESIDYDLNHFCSTIYIFLLGFKKVFLGDFFECTDAAPDFPWRMLVT
jgi:hypothetical protein